MMRRVIPLLATFGTCLAASALALAAETVKIVSIEGANTTWQVRDIGGRQVTVNVPSNNLADVKGAMAGKDNATETVQAKVVSMDAQTNRIKAQTQAGQVIVLEVPTASMSSISIGAPMILELPRMSQR